MAHNPRTGLCLDLQIDSDCVPDLTQVNADNLIWIDLEMTGLDTSADRIIEIATIVTDGKLEPAGRRPGAGHPSARRGPRAAWTSGTARARRVRACCSVCVTAG